MLALATVFMKIPPLSRRPLLDDVTDVLFGSLIPRREKCTASLLRARRQNRDLGAHEVSG